MSYTLHVNQGELLEGLKQITKLVKKKKIGQGVITNENGKLVVYLEGISIEASAEGALPGMVRVDGTVIQKLSKVLPHDNPLTIQLDGEHLFIGSFSIPCHWANVEPNPVQIPMDASLTDILGLELRHSNDEIFKSSLSNKLSDALSERNKLISWAANKLAPLGVTTTDIEELVDKAVRRANKQ